MPKTYKESEILISLQCQGPWQWTAAVEGGDFEDLHLVTHSQHSTPAKALCALANEFEICSQKEIFYHRIGMVKVLKEEEDSDG